MEKTSYALELKGITKAFGTKVVANKDVDLQVKKGEILAILGENGSGKTTLMNMVSGIYFPIIFLCVLNVIHFYSSNFFINIL